MSQSDQKAGAIWRAAVRARKQMIPAFRAEQRRIKKLTGFDTITQSSYHTGLNLPEGSDFDMAIVGLGPEDLPGALARVQAARLAPEVRVIDLEGHGRRPGYTVRYTNPVGIPVDLQIRRQLDLDHLAPGIAKLAALPVQAKKRIVFEKYRRKDDKEAYLEFKNALTSWAGFPSDYWNLKPLPQVRRNAGGSPLSVPGYVPHADYYLVKRTEKPGFFFSGKKPAYYLVNNIRSDAFASTSEDSSPQTYDPLLNPWYLMSVFDHMTKRNQATTSVTLVDEFTGRTRKFSSISEFISLAGREKGNWERLITRTNPKRNPNRPAIFLDLDNTLICAVPVTGSNLFGGRSLVCPDGERFSVFLRPGLADALSVLARHADLHLFTAATEAYADRAVEILYSVLPAAVRFSGVWCRNTPPRQLPSCSWVLVDDRQQRDEAVARKMQHIQFATLCPGRFIWVKPFWVAPEEAHARVSSFADYVPQILEAVGVKPVKTNPVTVEVTPEAGSYRPLSRHGRVVLSPAAHRTIEEKGKKIPINIIYRLEIERPGAYPPRVEPGTPGALTLSVDPRDVDKLGMACDEDEKAGGRELRLSLYTLHTILHRLGDEIMPGSLGFASVRPAFMHLAKTVPMEDLQDSWLALNRACAHGIRRPAALAAWLCAVVNTKACREGWIVDKSQALAELVPMHFLYGGIKFLPTPEHLCPVPELRAQIDHAAVRAAQTLGDYVNHIIERLIGMKLYI